MVTAHVASDQSRKSVMSATTFGWIKAAKTGSPAGVLRTHRGDRPDTQFMPVGTQGVVKTLTPGEVERPVRGRAREYLPSLLRPGPESLLVKVASTLS